MIHANTFEILPKLIENSKMKSSYILTHLLISEKVLVIFMKNLSFLENLDLKTLNLIIFEYHSTIKTPEKSKIFKKLKKRNLDQLA